MLDYLRWRGDLPLTSVPFGEVDGLILSEMSMLLWEVGLTSKNPETLRSLWPLMNNKHFSFGMSAADDIKLLEFASGCERFENVIMADYLPSCDRDSAMQFAAVTFLLPDGTAFISYRGTDDTLVGWKEDFKMSCSTFIPSQKAALVYLKTIASQFGGALRVGGHSKGGNLAMYASAMAGEGIRKRVVHVYNYDGPGFKDNSLARTIYGRINSVLTYFVPHASIVGLLLNHSERLEIIKSKSRSIFQHDPYSWQVEGGHFVRVSDLSKDSRYIELVIKRCLLMVNEEERLLFIDILFHVLEAANTRKFSKTFLLELFRHPKAVLSSIQDIDQPSKKHFIGILKRIPLAFMPSPKAK